MTKTPDPHILAHLEWLGFVRPMGLVVSAPALVRAGAILPRSDAEGQRLLLECLETGSDGDPPRIADFRRFARTVLGWSFAPQGYAGVDGAPIPPDLTAPAPEFGETIVPDLAVRERDPAPGAPPWQLLVHILPPGADFDRVLRGTGRLELSPHSRMERLLRHTGVSAGLICNGAALRLISAPRGESSGWLDFRVAEMRQTAGRPIVAALRLLLSEQRLLALPREQRLAALLAESRRFQNEVSERLAEQVLEALYALLRGFQAANAECGGALLRDVLRDDPDTVYRGLLTVILRLVFLLYAEERDMLPEDAVWEQNYSLAGLYEQLRADAALHPDTMHQRYGAWARLLTLFRMVFDGAPELGLPRRHGVLFDPDRFPFLEGRPAGSVRQRHQRITPPRVPDGAVYQALDKLLLLDGERISYRALDVEQIGSVYETMMGFRLETAAGRALAIRSDQRGGAPTTINLDALLDQAPAQREKWLRDQTDRAIPPGVSRALAAARTIDDLHAALLPMVDTRATPDIAPPGAMVLQPGQERRRSGSHYTPRALTGPIVRTTLAPILDRLRGPDGLPPRPDQILDLKICDPAMGSGAFLVEACRQLADALIEAWRVHGGRPPIPADEDEVIFARRLIAQRCLYGVDKNPTATDLAKVSLWLVTLAKDHPFTFLDHALRHGDSLVGLTQRQIEAFHWQGDAPRFQAGFETLETRQQVARAADLRARIRHASEGVSDAELNALWQEAQQALARVRLYGDLAVAAFFAGRTAKEREARRRQYAADLLNGDVAQHAARLDEWRRSDPPLAPFHWEIEFPEVFQRANPGFDAVVGNPPFLGGSKISSSFGAAYLDWVLELHEESHGNGDLVAHFFRRAFDLIRQGGTLGLIATNTIAQGDTRSSGLRWICTRGGEIYKARKRLKWPGLAAVVVSVVHIHKGAYTGIKRLDGREVETITAFLFHRGGHDDPVALAANQQHSFLGVKTYGQGFLFTDDDPKATPLAEMERLIAANPACREVIFPYIGGEELNSSPTHAHHRYVINFGDRDEAECRQRWPELMAIVEAKVKPERLALRDTADGQRLKKTWWLFARNRPELHAAIAPLARVLTISRVGQHAAFAFLPTGMVFSESLVIFPLTTYAAFCALQARPHEFWARFFGS
ncbi:MAG: N-6 DNA methylase, partial [Planctomycetota bacterium]|nr:N-6 DNA methylase [Planctomycetota bacterium]